MNPTFTSLATVSGYTVEFACHFLPGNTTLTGVLQIVGTGGDLQLIATRSENDQDSSVIISTTGRNINGHTQFDERAVTAGSLARLVDRAMVRTASGGTLEIEFHLLVDWTALPRCELVGSVIPAT
jgi:hypothetical protein